MPQGLFESGWTGEGVNVEFGFGRHDGGIRLRMKVEKEVLIP
jgi:hypothetical protein